MEVRKEHKYFTIVEHEKEQEYLREKQKDGWKFVKVTGLGTYHFEKCEPEDVIYQLDYNQDGLAHKEEYVQMFRDCGWEYLQDFFGYSYFRKPAAQMSGNEEEIFCDDHSRLEMMKRVFKGRLVPLLVIFSCILVPQFLMNMFGAHNDFNNSLAVLFGVLIVLYVLVFATWTVKYLQYKRKTEK